MQTTNVKIKFETFNDHNFLIDISGPDGSVMQGLSLLQEELPAEISFHVPEAYHKRIIGVGGRSIQRIMKKYGVYVKFSNAEEFAALGGYGDNDDNVVARTPGKNAINLENLKQSVMELVNPKVRRAKLVRVAYNLTSRRTRISSTKPSLSLEDTTELCWARKVFSFTILKPRPIRVCGSRIKRQHPMWLLYMDQRAKYRSPLQCYW